MPVWRNRQTYQTQNLAMATSCGFKSHHRHQKKALAIASAFFSEIRLRRVKYGFAMWNSYAVKYLLRKCEEANFISHRTKWDISQFSQENYFTFTAGKYFTKRAPLLWCLRFATPNPVVARQKACNGIFAQGKLPHKTTIGANRGS